MTTNLNAAAFYHRVAVFNPQWKKDSLELEENQDALNLSFKLLQKASIQRNQLEKMVSTDSMQAQHHRALKYHVRSKL